MTDIAPSPCESAIPRPHSTAVSASDFDSEDPSSNLGVAATDDELEARTLKYSRALSIVPLSSGRYALFLPFSNEDGKPLAVIGAWADLEKPLREYREPERAAPQRRVTAINLDELFGEQT